MKYKQNTDRISTKWKISTKWNAHPSPLVYGFFRNFRFSLSETLQITFNTIDDNMSIDKF